MIRDAIECNEAARPTDFELEKLRELLPEYFDVEGNFKIDRLQETLKASDVDINREGYEIKFLGKSYAKYLSSTKSEKVLIPDVEHNSLPENQNSENIYIVGDNLDAIKHLLGTYRGEVKCIYLDPPYNTGSDGFVYNDDFGFTAEQLVDKVGISEKEAQRIIELQGKSSHSAWLTFMYPRLQLAQQLLHEDGVIFISIDENEAANLKLVCDEVFGEQNFQASISVVANPGGRDYTEVAVSHESLLVYGKTDSLSLNEIPKEVTFRLSDGNGGFELRELRNRNPKFNRANRPNLYYPFYVDPNTKTDDGYCEVSLQRSSRHTVEVFPRNSKGEDSCWRWGKPKSGKAIGESAFTSEVVAKQKRGGGWNIYEKNRRSTTKVKSVWSDTNMRTEEGTRLINTLFGAAVFDHPKPLSLLERVLEIGADPDSLIVDFFSGSATTAHAAMSLNAKDQGTRKTILVQIDDGLKADSAAATAGYATIDEIGRDRIKKAAKSIKEETGADIDYGFRVYRLETPQNADHALSKMMEFDPENQTLIVDDFVPFFASENRGATGRDTILTTWMLQDGYGLTTAPAQVVLDDYTLYVVGDTAYIIEPGLTTKDVIELVRKVESGELNISRIPIFVYSMTFDVMHELKKNLNVLKSGKTVSIIERF